LYSINLIYIVNIIIIIRISLFYVYSCGKLNKKFLLNLYKRGANFAKSSLLKSYLTTHYMKKTGWKPVFHQDQGTHRGSRSGAMPGIFTLYRYIDPKSSSSLRNSWVFLLIQ